MAIIRAPQAAVSNPPLPVITVIAFPDWLSWNWRLKIGIIDFIWQWLRDYKALSLLIVWMTGSPFYSVHYASMLTRWVNISILWTCSHLSRAEVSQHSSKERCLVIIKGMIYDLSSYMHSHPGGSHIIRRYAGRDATKAFEPIHPNGVIEKNLPPEY